MGFEPTTHGTTIRYSNLLSYYHHIFFCDAKVSKNLITQTKKQKLVNSF